MGWPLIRLWDNLTFLPSGELYSWTSNERVLVRYGEGSNQAVTLDLVVWEEKGMNCRKEICQSRGREGEI
jgi:hypothetical protein